MTGLRALAQGTGVQIDVRRHAGCEHCDICGEKCSTSNMFQGHLYQPDFTDQCGRLKHPWVDYFLKPERRTHGWMDCRASPDRSTWTRTPGLVYTRGRQSLAQASVECCPTTDE